jgi:hypothetical protein
MSELPSCALQEEISVDNAAIAAIRDSQEPKD